ncbi:hypothetical protein Mapa_018596 [Marchantia paleacea]|nr:hypothetical protein Mapa_018596 [Marchantia paleacea]
MVRTTKGKDTKIIAKSTPIGLKTIFIFNHEQIGFIHPLSLNTVIKVNPPTEVGRANGRSTVASKSFFPGNSYLTKTQARIRPKIALIIVANKAVKKVKP